MQRKVQDIMGLDYNSLQSKGASLAAEQFNVDILNSGEFSSQHSSLSNHYLSFDPERLITY